MNAAATIPAPAPVASLAPGAGAAVRTLNTLGQSHPLFTPALGRILAARAAQVEQHGHSPEADAATGAHALAYMARQRILRAEQQLLKEIDKLTQESCDQLHGNADRVAHMTDGELATVDRRLAQAGALIIAAMDVLDRTRETA